MGSYPFGAAVLNNVKLGPEKAVDDNNKLINVNMVGVVFANNSNFNNVNFTTALTALSEVANTSFMCSQITGSTTTKVYGQNFYAKGISGRLWKDKTTLSDINSLYKSPLGQSSCSNAFIGPGVDLRNEKIKAGKAGVPTLISVSLEDANLDGVELTYVSFSKSLKNASFVGSIMNNVIITDSIEGTDFTDLQAIGKAATDRGVDLSGANELTATSKMPVFIGAQMPWASMMTKVKGSPTNMLNMTKNTKTNKIVDLSNALFNADSAADNVLWKYVDMEDANLENSKWGSNRSAPVQLLIDGSSFKGAILRNAKAVASNGTTVFTGVPTLTYTNFEGSNLTRCTFFKHGGTLAEANWKQSRFVKIKHDTAGMTAATLQKELSLTKAQILLVRNKDLTFFGLPGGLTGVYSTTQFGLDLSNFTIDGVAFKAGQQMGRSNMKNLIIQNSIFGGTASASTTCAMEFLHQTKEEANYLENFQIMDCDMALGTIIVVSVTTDKTKLGVWGSKATELKFCPAGVNKNNSTKLGLFGINKINGNKQVGDNTLRNARTVGGAYHNKREINWGGISTDEMTYAIQECDLSKDKFKDGGVGIKNNIKLTVAKFDIGNGCSLPKYITNVDNMTLSPYGAIGVLGTNVTVLANKDFTDATMNNMNIHADFLAGTAVFKNANLKDTDFHLSNLNAASLSFAILNEKTDFSECVQTANAKITGRDIIGSTTKLHVKGLTNTYTYKIANNQFTIA